MAVAFLNASWFPAAPAVAFDQAARFMAVGNHDAGVDLWDVSSVCDCVASVDLAVLRPAGTGAAVTSNVAINALAWTHNARLLAVAYSDGVISLLDVLTLLPAGYFA